MPTKEEFSARIAAELKARKAQKAKRSDEQVLGDYLRAKGNGRGKKCLNTQFYQC